MIEIETALPAAPALRAAPAAPPRRLTTVLGTTALVVGAVAALTAVFYAASVHTVAGNADGATAVLQGQSMSSGNLLLHHWSLSLDSFWTVDVPFYALTVPVAGVSPALLHLTPALIAALVVVVGAALARAGHRGAAGAAAVGAVVAILVFPSHVLARYFLAGPLHVGTALWCLLAFAGLRRARFGGGWVAAVVLLAAGLLGDFQMLAMGVLPAALAGVATGLRTRQWRRGVPLVAAAVAGVALAGAVRVVASAAGTFAVATSHPTATGMRLLSNLGLIVTWGAHMLGAGGGRFGLGGVPTPLELFHVVGLAALVAGVGVAALRLVTGVWPGHPPPEGADEAWRLEDLLVLAFLGDLALFVVLTYQGDQALSRYLTGAVVFGAVLCGRLAARIAQRLTARSLRLVAAASAAVVLAAFTAGLAFELTARQPALPDARLAAFLYAHHLDLGVGDYWSASITTVQSKEAVTVRPVIATPGGHIGRYDRQSEVTWYGTTRFQFLVYDSAGPWGGVTSRNAERTFGPIAHTYHVGPYRVLVWGHRIVVRGSG